MVFLNDEAGWKLVDRQVDVTPLQKYVYIVAKDENTPDSVKENQSVNKGQRLIQ